MTKFDDFAKEALDKEQSSAKEVREVTASKMEVFEFFRSDPDEATTTYKEAIEAWAAFDPSFESKYFLMRQRYLEIKRQRRLDWQYWDWELCKKEQFDNFKEFSRGQDPDVPIFFFGGMGTSSAFHSSEEIKEYLERNACRAFCVSKERRFRAKIHSMKHDVRRIALLGQTELDNGKMLTRLFDTGASFTLYTDFYVYEIMRDGKPITLLSYRPERPVAPFEDEGKIFAGECWIEGNEYWLDDRHELSKKSGFKSKRCVFVVNKVTPIRPLITCAAELEKKTAAMGVGRELVSWLFSKDGLIFSLPPKLERLLLAFLFHARHGDKKYPSHVMLISRPGTGKTTIIDSIYQKFDEEMPIVEGSVSTIKSLTPSFASKDNPQHGALLQARRLVAVDEFLRILTRVDYRSRDVYLGMLNSLLEFSSREYGSGHGSICGSMTAKLISVTNAIYGSGDAEALCNTIDVAFLSRMLIVYIDDDMKKHVQSNPVTDVKKTYSAGDFLSVYDYLQTFVCKYDRQRAVALFNRFLENDVFPENVRDMYAARYRHHCLSLLDGIIKTRCLLAGDFSFAATEQDYADLEDLWLWIIRSWGVTNVGLSATARLMLEHVSRQDGRRARVDDLKGMFADNYALAAEQLKLQQMIYQMGNYLYASAPGGAIEETVEVKP